MPAYNASDFDPPAPVAYVTLRNRLTGAMWVDVPMQLDSGADVTLVPQAAVSRLGLNIMQNQGYELIGFAGQTTVAAAVQLELVFCRRTFRGQFLLIDQEMGIIGRNLLNEVALLFDGPHLEWSEDRPK